MFNNGTTLHKQNNNSSVNISCILQKSLSYNYLNTDYIGKGFHLITCKCTAIYLGFAFQYTCISFAVSDTFIKQHSMHMVDHRNSMLGCIALSIKEHTYIVHVSRNIIFFLVLRKDV